MAIETINPANGELIERFEETTDAEVDRALDRAQAAFEVWRERPMAERAERMRAAAAHLETHVEEHARIITLEMGKTIGEARAEVRKCAWNCRHYAAEAERYVGDEPAPSNAAESYVAFRPLGVVLAIMPWNFPYWQMFRFAAPALMAGNGAILKHASNVPRSALAIERVFRESGFPEGLLRTLLIGGSRAEPLVDDPRIAAVTLTGSEEVGRRIGRRAGGALKKAVLELGGSDPFVVLGDADVDEAARVAVRARFQNAGQSCIAAKRFIVEKSVIGPFLERFAAAARALVVGDPALDATQMGPMARHDLRGELDGQVRRSIAAGAKLACGGAPIPGPGAFFAPTILTAVRPGMAAFDEETFGPVAAVVEANDAEDALALANRSRFGLGSNLWTRDLDRAKRLAARVEAGSVFINGMVASDPRLPFGGVKASGYGRELAAFGIREFTNIQTVWIGPAKGEAPRSE